MKLSPTQRALLAEALPLREDQAELDWYFGMCVYRRNLTGLIRVGAVVRDPDTDHWRITSAAIEELT